MLKHYQAQTGPGAYLEDAAELSSVLTPYPRIMVGKAIKFITAAWNSVTPETISNCWNKTDILPFELLSEICSEDAFSDNVRDLEIGLSKLAKHLPAPPVNALAYIEIDKPLSTSCSLGLNTIVDQVLEEEGLVPSAQDEDDQEDRAFIPYSAGISSLKTAIDCYQQASMATSEQLDFLEKILSNLELEQHKNLKQSTLDKYFAK